MNFPIASVRFHSFFLSMFCLLASALTVFGQDMVRIERIKSQSGTVYPSAVRVANAPLVHTAQLLPPPAAGDTRSEGARLLGELERLMADYHAGRDDLVKLNVYVRSAAVRRTFLEDLTDWTSDKLPAVSFVGTRLPDEKAHVALDAVFVCRKKSGDRPTRDALQKKEIGQWARASVLPMGDVVYVSGQAQPGDLAGATRATLDELRRTLEHMGLGKQDIVELKCFLEPMKDVATVNRQLAEFFGNDPIPPVSHVEWKAGSLPIEIELIAYAPPKESMETVTYRTPPWMKSSPVFSRVARIHGNDRIYISGLYSAKPGGGAEEVRSVFEELKSILKETDSDLKHLAKATYYVSDDDSSRELNRLRPEYYDPERPPAASKAAVADVGMPGRGLTIDMIAAPAAGK